MEQQFLDAIALQVELTGDSLEVFFARFSRENAVKQNSTLVSFITWNHQPVDSAQKLQDELARICEVLEKNGCPIKQKGRGRAPKGHSPWEQAYKWLWESRFPEWQGQNLPLALNQQEPNGDSQADVDELVREVRDRIRPTLQKRYDKIRLLNGEQVEVTDLYVEVYLLGSKRFNSSEQTILESHDLETDRLAIAKRGDRIPGVTAIERFKRLVVLGKPGMGKSTFLQYLAIACNQGDFQPQAVPVLLEFRDLDENKLDLVSWITTRLKLADLEQTKQLLNSSRVLLLLDGLDEVPEQWQKTVQVRLRDFFDSYEQVQTIVSCRTQTTEFVPPGFECVEIAEFKPEQIRAFAKNWFIRLDAEEGHSKEGRFLGIVEVNKPIAELMQTPLLLSLACWIFQDRNQLPSRRSELYEQGVNLLLSQWDEIRAIDKRHCNSEVYRSLDIDQRKNLLTYLAYHKFTNPQSEPNREANFILFQQSEIEDLISEHLSISRGESYKVLKAIESENGLLVARAWKIWSFSHLTLQEYFVAYWFVQHQDWRRLAQHVYQVHWREVFLLATELANESDTLLKAMQIQINTSVALDESLKKLIFWAYERSDSSNFNPKHKLLAYYVKLALDRVNFTIVVTIYDDEGVLMGDSQGFLLEENFKLNFEPKTRKWFNEFEKYHIEIRFRLYAQNYMYKRTEGIEWLASSIDDDYIKGVCEPKLENKLKVLSQEFSNKDSYTLEMFKCWWQANGESWLKTIKDLLIEHRNTGFSWKFSKTQKDLLQKYYVGNQLLADCLNIAQQSSNINEEVRQEIEETLLLPIAEIKKRRKNK